jgi:hypothetical protein
MTSSCAESQTSPPTLESKTTGIPSCSAWLWVAAIAALLFAPSSLAQSAGLAPLPPRYSTQKKLIEFPWSTYFSTFIRDNITNLETRPFDGVVFFNTPWPSMGGGGSILYSNAITTNSLALDVLQAIKWNKFTDNFILADADSVGHRANWFDDAGWTNVVANARLLALAVQTARAKGIFFDPEHYYDTNLWYYSTNLYPAYTFGQVQAEVRLRGKALMQGLCEQDSNITVFATFLYSKLMNSANITNDSYGLLKGFCDGMLDGAGPQAMLIEGYETSYYLPNTSNWVHHNGNHYYYYDYVGSEGGLIAPEIAAKARTNLQVGAAIYYRPGTFDPITNVVQQRMLEHNIYQGLLNSDEYVWFYSEEPKAFCSNSFPAEATAAIQSARDKYLNGLALGFSISSAFNFCNTANPPLPVTANVFYSPGMGLIITNPVNNQSFTTNQEIWLQAAADSNVKNVSFYGYWNLSNIALSNISTAPFLYDAGTLSPGTYLVFAVGTSTSNTNDFVESGPVTFTVALPPPQFTGVTKTNGNQLQLDWTNGTANSVLLASTNAALPLNQWTPLVTNPALPYTISNPADSSPTWFFRVQR